MKYPKHMAIKTYGKTANGFESICWHYLIEDAHETLCGESIDSLLVRKNTPPANPLHVFISPLDECKTCKKIKKKTEQPQNEIMKELNESLPNIFPNYYDVFPDRK